MNSSGSYFGQADRYALLGQLQPTPTHNRPNNQTQYPSGRQPTPAKTSNGLACAPTRPTTFMNKPASFHNANMQSIEPQSPERRVTVHFSEVTQWRCGTFETTPQGAQQLLDQGFTEISSLECLPGQNVETRTTITTVDPNRNQLTQPVPRQVFQQLSAPSSPTRTPSVTPPHCSPQGYSLAKESGAGSFSSLPQPWNNIQLGYYDFPNPYNRGGPEGF
ncbi:hypothetical protein [Endozoicomonas atrinae]|uniref:hypothetical protein n=1 Tax=Endozoicomonas atrinae TaxID=1333660 RepID=UPI000A523C2D|nr:hypothetical protein [Endozoicomonas atrinae]